MPRRITVVTFPPFSYDFISLLRSSDTWKSISLLLTNNISHGKISYSLASHSSSPWLTWYNGPMVNQRLMFTQCTQCKYVHKYNLITHPRAKGLSKLIPMLYPRRHNIIHNSHLIFMSLLVMTNNVLE